MVKFIYKLQKHIRNTETFVFGAQLKRITNLISYRSINVALSMLSHNVLFWSGGAGNYEPLCIGMATAMPYIDYFLSCNNLKALETFVEVVNKV